MSTSESRQQTPIAIVGLGALFPGSADVGGFWRDLLAGRDLIRDVPESHWLIDDYYDPDPSAPDKTYARRGAFLDPVDFDALGFGVPPSTMPATDTSQLLALIVAQAVLDDASGGQFEAMDRSRMSVVLGVTSGQDLMSTMVARLQRPVWVKALRESGLPEDEVQAACDRIAAQYVPWQEASFPGLLGNVVAGRIANRLNLGGTNCVTDAACASSLSALAMAVHELELGDSDLAIAGGVDTLNDIFMYMCFSKTPALSASGDCRPFSAQADGTMLGEGLGMVALKRLADAERDGDRIYAVLRGLGSSSDGRSKSVYAPVSEGQAKALRRTYALAGYGPETVELMEAHGTGTKAGDVAEFEGLRQVFAAEGATRPWCALGSVKSQIGHTKAAAGAAGLIKAVLALHHQVLPPTIKVDAPNPKLGLPDSPFYLNTRARPWIRDSAHPRRAAVSAFGFGGSNFHATLEEYRGPAPRAARFDGGGVQLFALTAASTVELLAQARTLAEDSHPFASRARASQRDWQSGSAARLVLLASDEASLRARLDVAMARIAASPDAGFALPDGSAYGCGPAEGKLALLFPGQGSQYLDMGAALAMRFPLARAAWDRAADLAFDTTHRLHEVVFPPPQFDADAEAADLARLTATHWAQPAIGCTSLSQLALLDDLGLDAAMVAGHSFGELVALHAAGVVDADALLRMARRRGELMAEAAGEPGAMAALALPVAEVRALIAELAPDLVVANHNAPKQVVVSGPAASVDGFTAQLAARNIAARRLPVANAFHSRLVAPACEPFAGFLHELAFAAPNRPVYGNAAAAPHPSEPDALRAALAQQIAEPVRFVEMIEAMYADGARCFVEVGPGAVLTGLTASILDGRAHQAIALDRKGRDGVEALLVALARIAALGFPLQLDRLFAAEREPAPVRASKSSLPISGSNFGKVYPPAGGTAALPAPNPPRPVPVIIETPVSQHSPSAQQVVPASMPVSAPVDPAQAAAWLAAFQQTQQQTASAHAVFQQAMFDSHAAYLRMAESALQGLGGLLGTGALPPALQGALPSLGAAAPMAPVVAAPSPVQGHLPIPSPIAMPATPGGAQPMPAPPGLTSLSSMPVTPQVVSPRSAAAQATGAAVPSPAASMSALPVTAGAGKPASPALATLHTLMLEVVADKTGYPVEMLTLDMDLEGDLGVDSIKRVEILAAVEARAPDLPKVDRARLSALHTLREIVDYLRGDSEDPMAVTPSPSAVRTAQVVTPTANTAAGIDLPALMLAVVADKTGYPVDMLKLDMDLEGDLGVDSIKRVEILAAVEERAPGLPKVDRARLSALHTLREIVDYLRGESDDPMASAPTTSASRAATTAPAPAPAPSPALAGIDLPALMLAVVAEKTGYPVDMLNLDMDLEGDLGVDSIKRVEILAAVEERAPGLPKVDRARLSALHTLAEIVAYLRGESADPMAVAEATPAASVAAATPRAAAALGRYGLELIAAPPTGLAQPGLLAGGEVCILGEASLAAALATELQSRGVKATAVDELPAGARACIHLAGLREVTDIEAARAINREVFAIARRLAPALGYGRGLFVTVQDTGGDFGLAGSAPERAWLAGLPALVKTAALEWPQASLKAIDLQRGSESPAQSAVRIADELLAGGGEIEVALPAAGGRYTLCSRARPLSAHSLDAQPIKQGDVVVVTGGARGVTAACLVEWAKRCQPRLLLLGRTPLRDEPAALAGVDESGLKRALLAQAETSGQKLTPSELQAQVNEVLGNREIRATLAALAAAGSEARYVAADVADADTTALAATLDGVRADWGPIRGLIHAAGVLADKRIAEKTDAQFERVFAAKVDGLRRLLALTANDPLQLLAVFSSVSARCGNTGQADYAMANEVLAKVMLAEAARRPGVCVKSFGWGPWEAGMVSPALRARFAELGVPMIPLQTGARMFADELVSGDAQVELVLGGEPRPEALLADGAEARVQTLELGVQRASHAYLEGHAIDGVPVLPAVLAAEWMSRAARGFRPGLELVALHELKVQKGIRLRAFDNGGDVFVVEARPLAGAEGVQLQMQVRDRKGMVHYSARAELRALAPSIENGLPALALDAWQGEPLYQNLLFHRGAFELIESVEGISDSGVGATLRGVSRAGWQDEGWQLDVAALDAGLQMAVLYGHRLLGGPNLPTAIGELRRYGSAPVEGPIRATAQGRRLGEHAVSTDIVFADASGRRFAELRGVHNHALPRG